MSSRVQDKVTRGSSVELVIDGQTVTACKGETIAAVLLLQDKTVCYKTKGQKPRTMFCNMGTCFECRVLVQTAGAEQWVLACKTPITPNMVITTNINFSEHRAAGHKHV